MFEDLGKHPHMDIYNKVNSILNEFFEPVSGNNMDMSDSIHST